MRKILTKDIIPLLISIFLLLTSVGIILFTEYTLNYKHYVGVVLIGISTILFFKNKNVFIYVFGITLILGIINLIDIYYSNIIIGIGPITFNPIFLTLFIIFFALNKETFNKMFPKKEMTENELAEKNSKNINLIKNYERKFESKTESELKNIADEKSRYVNEAKIASKNILKNKYVL
jgi:glucan phosphoethanolaminetransferase (alkaline phosphatase superfamily)